MLTQRHAEPTAIYALIVDGGYCSPRTFTSMRRARWHRDRMIEIWRVIDPRKADLFRAAKIVCFERTDI